MSWYTKTPNKSIRKIAWQSKFGKTELGLYKVSQVFLFPCGII
jgi:hypothetical protein